MDELFSIGETLSPRIQWMRANGIRTKKTEYLDRSWMAIKEPDFARGDTEEEALDALAAKLGLPLWNDQGDGSPDEKFNPAK